MHTDTLQGVYVHTLTSMVFRPVMDILRELQNTKGKYSKMYTIGCLTIVNIVYQANTRNVSRIKFRCKLEINRAYCPREINCISVLFGWETVTMLWCRFMSDTALGFVPDWWRPACIRHRNQTNRCVQVRHLVEFLQLTFCPLFIALQCIIISSISSSPSSLSQWSLTVRWQPLECLQRRKKPLGVTVKLDTVTSCWLAYCIGARGCVFKICAVRFPRRYVWTRTPFCKSPLKGAPPTPPPGQHSYRLFYLQLAWNGTDCPTEFCESLRKLVE